MPGIARVNLAPSPDSLTAWHRRQVAPVGVSLA